MTIDLSYRERQVLILASLGIRGEFTSSELLTILDKIGFNEILQDRLSEMGSELLGG